MATIGELTWKKSGPFLTSTKRVVVPLLEQAFPVHVDPEADRPTDRQFASLQVFLALKPELRTDFSHEIALDCWNECRHYASSDEEPPVRLQNRHDVWNHFTVKEVLIPKHQDSEDRYVFLLASCEWEPEHGLELLFKNGILFRVGRQDGLFCKEEWTKYFVNE